MKNIQKKYNFCAVSNYFIICVNKTDAEKQQKRSRIKSNRATTSQQHRNEFTQGHTVIKNARTTEKRREREMQQISSPYW